MGDESPEPSTSGHTTEGPFSEAQIKSDMTSKEAYFELLRTWVNQANMSQNAMACFPYYLMANYPQLFQAQVLSSATGTNQVNQNPFGQNGVVGAAGNAAARARAVADGGRIDFNYDSDLRQEEIINENGGYEFVIAPFWKRVLAEIVDVAILLLLKLMITFTIVDLFDLDFGFDFDLDSLRKSLEDDYTEFLSFSSDLLILEIITKIAVCFYEAIWTMSGSVYVGGATPGKVLLGLRVVYVQAVLPLQPAQAGLNLNNGTPFRALLYPATNPGFKRALFRAFVKNIVMALLFPMCFIMLFFKNNRTAYDVMTKTIVVEENHAPIQRRR